MSGAPDGHRTLSGLVIWTRSDELDDLGRSLNPKVPGSRPRAAHHSAKTITHRMAAPFILCPAAVVADPDSRSDQYLELDTERAIGLYGTSISSRQRKLMFKGSGPHERVVHRAPCNSDLGQSIQEISSRLCAQKARLRKVAAKKVKDGAWRATNRRRQASKDRKVSKAACPDSPSGRRPIALTVAEWCSSSETARATATLGSIKRTREVTSARNREMTERNRR
jgi:hypothetical protein